MVTNESGCERDDGQPEQEQVVVPEQLPIAVRNVCEDMVMIDPEYRYGEKADREARAFGGDAH